MMKKILYLFIGALLFSACHENTPAEPIKESDKYIGEYIHSGTSVNTYTVTIKGVKKTQTTEDSFYQKKLSIYTDSEDKLVAYGDRYGYSYAEIKDGKLYIESKEFTLYDDGTYIQKGGVLHGAYYHYGATINNDTLKWKTACTITEYNVYTGADLLIVSEISNTAIKQ